LGSWKQCATVCVLILWCWQVNESCVSASSRQTRDIKFCREQKGIRCFSLSFVICHHAHVLQLTSGLLVPSDHWLGKFSVNCQFILGCVKLPHSCENNPPMVLAYMILSVYVFAFLLLDVAETAMKCLVDMLCQVVLYCCMYFLLWGPVWVRGTPLSPLSIYFLIFSPFYFFLSFNGFTYFLLLSIPSISTRIVPLRFQAEVVGGDRTWV